MTFLKTVNKFMKLVAQNPSEEVHSLDFQE